MAARSIWKGYLKLSLVSVPVKAYTSTSSGGEIRLNQLHSECNSRINYKKTCPIHGEIESQDIVSGYEYSKGQYVIIDLEELDKLRTQDDRAIKMDAFVDEGAVDPIYFNGKGYYLVPDGPVGQKAYSVVHQAMSESKKYGIAQVVLHGKEQVGLVRPTGGLLAMTMLNYENQVTKPAAFAEEVVHASASAEELKLARAIIENSSVDSFDMGQYKDRYLEKLTQLIEAKVAGQELVASAPVEDVPVINLMEALKQSVKQIQKGSPSKGKATPKAQSEPAKPPKKMAPSKGIKPESQKKKKSS